TPTYMLAVVVDDHDMGITQIIRGNEHFTNAARQKQIYDALGWPVPLMAHIPLIHGPDGAKLSKRHGALGVDAYRAMGYLPTAMPGLKERAKTLLDLVEGARYIYSDRPLALDDKAAGLLTAEARSLLGEISDELRQVEPWTVEATEQAVRAFAERRGIKLGGVAQPLRAALTGRTTSPPIFDVLAVLGKNESLNRLQDQASAGPRAH